VPEKKKSARSVTKHTLAREVAYILDLPLEGRQGKAYEVVQTILRVVADALMRGETISIPGFGIFTPHLIPSRNRSFTFSYTGKPFDPNPNIGVEMVPAKKKIIFKPSKVLQRMLNGNPNPRD
jgi:nucleoid DNA-binding protein